MRSATYHRDDRTARARIRDAAIARIGDVGAARATIRDIAAAAGVSSGLVLHHFESKDGLRDACDEYVMSFVLAGGIQWLTTGESDSRAVLEAYREALPLIRYLARSLAEDAPTSRKLFDGLVEAGERSLELGVSNGLVQPSVAPHDRAVLLVAWQLGAIVLSPHIQRAFGEGALDTQLTTRIGRIGAEMLTGGVFADGRYRDATRGFGPAEEVPPDPSTGTRILDSMGAPDEDAPTGAPEVRSKS